MYRGIAGHQRPTKGFTVHLHSPTPDGRSAFVDGMNTRYDHIGRFAFDRFALQSKPIGHGEIVGILPDVIAILLPKREIRRKVERGDQSHIPGKPTDDDVVSDGGDKGNIATVVDDKNIVRFVIGGQPGQTCVDPGTSIIVGDHDQYGRLRTSTPAIINAIGHHPATMPDMACAR